MSHAVAAFAASILSMAQDATNADTAAATPSRTLLDYVRAGGFLGYVLIGLSVTAVTLVILNIVRNRAAVWNPPGAVEAVSRMVRDGDVEAARRFCAAPENESFFTAVIGAALTRCARSAFGFLELRSALEDAGAAEVDRRYRSVEGIALIAALGPMLGLLGTVIGLIGAFGSISQFEGAARSKELAGFMSLALVNTAQGLAVAIPCTAFYAIFRRRIDRLALEAGGVIESVAMPLERLGNDAGKRPAPRAAPGPVPAARAAGVPAP